MLFTTMTKQAMSIAYRAHHGQVDKAGVPYILHPARVAENFTNEAEACVAWLHDVLEDSTITTDDLRIAGFGASICTALEALCHDKSTPYMDYIRNLSNNRIARVVKMADLRDNMDTTRLAVVDDAAKSRLKKYHEAYELLEHTSSFTKEADSNG